MALSPGAMAILQARQQYATRPPQTDPYDPMAKPKPIVGGGPLTGSGPVLTDPQNMVGPPGGGVVGPGGQPAAPAQNDMLARMQRMNGYRAQHAQFNAGRRVYGNNNSGVTPVYDPSAWLPGQRPDQVAQQPTAPAPMGTPGVVGTLGGPGAPVGPMPNSRGAPVSPYMPKPVYGGGGGPSNKLGRRMGMI